MAFVKEKGECLCERCGHWWKTKPNPDGRHVEPRSCAKCKSKVWNQPRVYGGKYLDGLAPMARRYKPTGRAAAQKETFKKISHSSYQETFDHLLTGYWIAKRLYHNELRIYKEMVESGEVNDRYETGRAKKKEMDYILRLYENEMINSARLVCEHFEPHPSRSIAPEDYLRLSDAQKLYYGSFSK